MNISKIIEQFGYKPNEVKVYLAALQVVESTVSGIATKAKLPLSSAQVAIEKLHKDGLVNFYVRKHHKYWIAEHIRAIVPWESWSSLLGQSYLNDFINLRVRHFLNIKMLVPKTENTLKLRERDSKELRQTKFLPDNIIVEDALFIFNDNVAIITLNERQPTGVVIEDSATTRMMSVFFEDLWERGS